MMKISVIEYLIETTRKNPLKIAVEDGSGYISFKDMLAKACSLSKRIGSRRKSPVGIFLHKGKEMVTAFAATSLSGNFYVPLDTAQPETRIKNILSVLDCNSIITNSENYQKLSKVFSGEILLVDDYFEIEDKPITDIIEEAHRILSQSSPIDTDPVYSIFTSGSTGIPKGVVVNHRGVIDYIDWAVDTFGIDENTVIGNQAPFYFDNSTLDIYLMYATGATLQIIPEDKFSFPATLIDFLNEKKITFVFWVPFVLINVANFKILDKKKPLFLKDVFFAGEVMPCRQLNYWRNRLPECRYVNLYGPTEITVDCTYYVVDREFADNDTLPIGKPCRNTDILILSQENKLCEKGITGEICVRGSSLANGYYNNPQKTSDAFIQNPLNSHYPELIYRTGDLGYWNEFGEVMFVGRADSQIKHKGYRIELGEIENAIVGTKLVEEACVAYNHARQRITLIYSNPEELTVAALRSALSECIPVYMLPSVLIREERLQRNANGKIDRAHYNTIINK